MAWEEDVFAVLDDLESQASAAFAAERDLELADRARAEYSHVTWQSRLHASVGTHVVVELLGLGRVEGTLVRVGTGWCLLQTSSHEWVVNLSTVVAVEGASERAVPEVAWSPIVRLGLGSALRRLADAGAGCVLHGVDGAAHVAVLVRVGADFVEARVGHGRTLVVPFAAVSAVQRRDE